MGQMCACKGSPLLGSLKCGLLVPGHHILPQAAIWSGICIRLGGKIVPDWDAVAPLQQAISTNHGIGLCQGSPLLSTLKGGLLISGHQKVPRAAIWGRISVRL